MLLEFDRSQGYEDVLRSLGAVLDAHRARSVYIRDMGDGLLVRARVIESIDARLVGRWSSLDRTYTREAIAESRRAAVARRGSGHIAGPIERSLRLVGQQADMRSLRGLTLIQHHTDDGWMLWHEGDSDGDAELISMTACELDTLDAMTRSAMGRQPTMVGEP